MGFGIMINKAKYGEKAKLCYMDTEILFHCPCKNRCTYKDIAEDVETKFETSNYILERPLPKGKNKNVIGVTKDELGGKIMKEFVGLRAKAQSCLIDDGSEDKKAKGTKKCVIKRKLKFKDYENCLEIAQIENKTNHLEKNKFVVGSFKNNYKEFIKKQIKIKNTAKIKYKGMMFFLKKLARLL